jgi:hypothetical protein
MCRARFTQRVLTAVTALALVFVAGTSRPVLAQLPTDQGQRELEGRIANVNGELIQLGDGVVVRVPQGLAPQADLREGKTVKVKFQVKGGQNVATSIEVLGEASAGGHK